MKLILTSLIATILLPIVHLYFDNSDVQWYVLTFNDRLISFLWCISFFINTDKRKINLRSLLAIATIITFSRLFYYVLWLNLDINDLYVYPFTLILSIVLFLSTSLKNYNFKSDKIIDDNVYLCLWKPENAKTIFPSLIGSAIGSISIYAGGNLYGFKWKSDKFKKRQKLPKVIEKKFIVINTGKKFSQLIEKELKKLNSCYASIGKIKLLRFKCVYAIRNVLKVIGMEFSPSFFEFIPALYAKKILRWKNGRKYKV